MGKIIKMTSKKARQYIYENNEKLQTMYDEAPIISDGFFEEDAKPIARGMEEFQEYLDKQDKKNNRTIAFSNQSQSANTPLQAKKQD